jgi:hypothetical protein
MQTSARSLIVPQTSSRSREVAGHHAQHDAVAQVAQDSLVIPGGGQRVLHLTAREGHWIRELGGERRARREQALGEARKAELAKGLRHLKS